MASQTEEAKKIIIDLMTGLNKSLEHDKSELLKQLATAVRNLTDNEYNKLLVSLKDNKEVTEQIKSFRQPG